MKVSYILLFFLTTICTSCQAQQSITATNPDGSVTFLKSQNNINNVFVTADGNMGIGKKNPKDKLEVNGQIHAKSVKVDLKEWADYVFKKDYNLVRLREIENYINTHGHLPEVPSTIEVQKQGIDLGQMDILLLKKIEELTLHLIKKEHQVEELQNQLNILQIQISEIKEFLKE